MNYSSFNQPTNGLSPEWDKRPREPQAHQPS